MTFTETNESLVVSLRYALDRDTEKKRTKYLNEDKSHDFLTLGTNSSGFIPTLSVILKVFQYDRHCISFA